MDRKGDIFGIGDKINIIFGADKDKIWKKITRISMNNLNIKIKNSSLGDKNCYIIDELGQLYGMGLNNYRQVLDEYGDYCNYFHHIPLPKKCKKFIQASSGLEHLLCLVETKEGEFKIYAKGRNDCYQCGIDPRHKRSSVNELTPCYFSKNISFKYICSRKRTNAAISINGELYTWGNNQNNNLGHFSNKNDDLEERIGDDIRIPDRNNNIIPNHFLAHRLIDSDIDNIDNMDYPEINQLKYSPKKVNLGNKIVDKVAVCESHMLIIARENINGCDVKKLFICGNNFKGALGQKINSFSVSNLSNSIEEVKIIDDENSNVK